MSQILDSLPHDSSDRITCCYVNGANRIQIVRVTNIPDWYFERVVFPGQYLMFEALPEALLEIHSNSVSSAIQEDRIPCERLQVHDTNELLAT